MNMAGTKYATGASEKAPDQSSSMRSYNERPHHMSLRTRFAKVAVATVLAGSAGGIVHAPVAQAAAPRWVLVGKENFTIDGNTAKVPTYVNTNSIVGDRYDTFTVTFQGRFAGKYGINRVNVGVIVDCENDEAYADQFYVYYSAGSSDYERYDGGDISPRVQSRALSYCR
jgi:hypothetical protein